MDINININEGDGQLIKDIEALTNTAQTTGDILFRFPDGNEVHTHRFLVDPVELSRISSFSPPNIYTIPPSKLTAFNVLSHASICATLARQPRMNTDYTITLSSTPPLSLSVHRAWIGIRIPYFAALFRSPFRDSSASEASLPSDIITPPALRLVVRWVYDPCTQIFPTSVNTSALLDVETAADYLGITELSARIAQEAQKRAYIDPAGVLAGIAAREGCRGRMKLVWDYAMKRLARAVNRWRKSVLSLPLWVWVEVWETVEACLVNFDAAVKLWTEVGWLESRIISSASPREKAWYELVIDPLSTMAAKAIARHCGDKRLIEWLEETDVEVSFEAGSIGQLVAAAADEIQVETCKAMWELLNTDGGLKFCEARNRAVLWFKRHWYDCREAGEFDTWSESQLEVLATELRVPITDLWLEPPQPKKVSKKVPKKVQER